MTTRDARGDSVSGAGGGAVDRYETALHLLQCYLNDPLAEIDAALAESPGFVMGHALKAYLQLLGTEPAGSGAARAICDEADRLEANPRERGHLAAARLLSEGRWYDAGRVLEDLAIEHPRDALALQVGHLVDFYTGQSRMLRDRIGRARLDWSEGMPGYHAVLAMHAFGLEETGDYARAEAEGKRAIELEPRDGWAKHAVAHVMEMQGRQPDGVRWLRTDTDDWAKESFFAVHNWWHLALFHLDRDELDEVLALYDGPIFAGRTGQVLDLIDASALLWRLYLRGADTGDRFQALADEWEPLAEAGNYAFNDAHAVMAFVGAGREDAAGRVVAAQAEAMRRGDDNARFTAEVGAPVVKALRAFGAGEYGRTIDLLRPVRGKAAIFGGSHAQRDLIDLTLIEAAARDGRRPLVRALAQERLEIKPSSPLNRRYQQRAM